METAQELKINNNFENNPLVHYSENYLSFLELALPDSKIDQILLFEDGKKQGVFNFVTHYNEVYGTVLYSLPFFWKSWGTNCIQ